jgi:hypothetical protein
VIPFGAQLREQAGEVQYLAGGQWHTASGPRGTVTQALSIFLQRSGKAAPLATIVASVRSALHQSDGKLPPAWNLNDFGKWSWNLRRNGAHTAYYIHTTPPDEAASASNQRLLLTQSHGCIHIQPADRDEMMRKGYLGAGIAVEVKPYGIKGPP